MKEYDAVSRTTGLLYSGEVNDDINPEAMPIYQTSAFKLKNFAQQDDVYDRGIGYVYSRVKNPNRVALAQSMTFLERGRHSLIVSSGLSAITLGLMSIVKAGDHILASEAIYGESIYIISSILNEYGVSVTYVDFNDENAMRKAVQNNTRVMYLEIASNPLQVVTDVRKVIVVAREVGAKVMVDNTFTTPFVINPLELGADVVIHSLTKFINGHFDMVGGSITTTSDEIYNRGFYMKQFLGCGLAPHDCWLASRSLATAELRIKKQMDNAMVVARALEQHPMVERVYYPGLESSPDHQLAGELYNTGYGYGAILSFTIKEATIPECDAFFKRLNIIKFVNTLGGYKTTICHPATSGHRDVSQEVRDKLGITDGFVRLSCGVENPDDLVADLLQALDRMGKQAGRHKHDGR